MKRIGLCTLLLVPLALVSCGGDDTLGTYSFQMGKQSSSHITASITLKDSPWVNEEGKELGKNMAFYAQVQMGSKKSSSVNGSEESSIWDTSIASEGSVEVSIDTSEESSEEPSFDFEEEILEALARGVSIDAYYTIVPRQNARSRFTIGFDLVKVLEQLFGGMDGSDDSEGIPSIDLEPEIVEKIIYSEYDGKSIYLMIPVSTNDLFFQLYWYGFDVHDIENEPEAHEAGTHPTQEQVAEINKTYPLTHDGNFFRDFHPISLGIMKD